METLTDKPVPASVSEAIPLEKELEGMTRPQLVELAGEKYRLNIDVTVAKKSIIEEIVRADGAIKGQARKANEESARVAASETDQLLKIRFHRLDFPSADLEFNYTGKRGFKGPKNPKGFSKSPKYQLFPGEEYTLPRSVIEHLKSLTFSTHKTVFDAATGMVSGTIPIIKPRFIVEYVLTDEQLKKIGR